MNAQTQYKLAASDLEIVLALTRFRTLSQAGARLGLDGSTVFRALQRIEKGLGQRLFERTRSGYLASELALEMAGLAEQMEARLEAARALTQGQPEQVSGLVRITTTDTILHGLVAPALLGLRKQHPALSFDLHAGNDLASLTHRDADIAVRVTRRPPQHLVGKHVGPLRMAVYTARQSQVRQFDAGIASRTPWIAPDEALPDHPSVLWRKKHFPGVQPAFRVNSILTVTELIAQGMGIGVVPMFLAGPRKDLRPITQAIDECQNELWLLTHTESRHLRRVSTVFGHLSTTLQLQ